MFHQEKIPFSGPPWLMLRLSFSNYIPRSGSRITRRANQRRRTRFGVEAPNVRLEYGYNAPANDGEIAQTIEHVANETTPLARGGGIDSEWGVRGTNRAPPQRSADGS